MAVEKLYNSLDKARKALNDAIDAFDELSKSSVEIGGEIARVVTSQVQADIDIILDLIQGTNQNSIESLTEYIDAVPLKATRPEKASARYTGENSQAVPNVNLTPDTSNGPKSEIVQQQEDIDLSEYYKKNFVDKIRMRESDFEPNWDDIKSNDLFVNSCDLGNELSSNNFNDYIPGIDDIIDYEPYEDEEDNPINDYSNMPEMEDNNGTWKQAVSITNPDLNIVNEQKNINNHASKKRKLTEKDFNPEWSSIKDDVNERHEENSKVRENDYSNMPNMQERNGNWHDAIKALNPGFDILNEIKNYQGDIATGLNIQDNF